METHAQKAAHKMGIHPQHAANKMGPHAQNAANKRGTHAQNVVQIEANIEKDETDDIFIGDDIFIDQNLFIAERHLCMGITQSIGKDGSME